MTTPSKLRTTTLGKNGPKVNQLGIGLMGLSAFYGKPKPDPERYAFLDKVYESGELFWDTADVYMDNEDLIGTWLKANPGKREHIFLATKFANQWSQGGGLNINTSPEYAREACEKSLARLGLPSVDLYYIHRVDAKTPVEHTMEELVKLKNEGKFKYIGISECSASTLRRAHAVHPITAVQVEYSPFALDIESEQIDVLRTARELGIAIVCYSPIGRGMLSGKYKGPEDFEEGDFRRIAPRFSKENFPKNMQLVERLNKIAEKKGCTPAQLSLAWLMAQGADVIPIPGTTNQDRLAENLGSLDVKLTEEEVKAIRDACEAAEPAGSRYPEAMASACYADSPPLKA